MTRRRVLAAGLGVAAASVALGWALRRQLTQLPAAEADIELPAPAEVWNLRFARPGGGDLALGAFRGRPLVLNFWATWCPPCIEEMPLLDRFEREQRNAGWQVVGLAVDSEAPVQDFLARHPVGFAIGLAGTQGIALSRSLGNARGALPFSVIFDARGEPVARKLGLLNWPELVAWVDRLR